MPPRRSSCTRTRRRRCSDGWPTAFARASIPERVVTYIIDRNVNYTNVCVARCNFCAFYRPGRLRRRLRARVRGDLPEDRRDHRARRRPAAAAGRPQSRPAARVVRGPVPGGEVAVPGLPAARAVASRSAAHLAAVAAAGAGGDRAADRRRAGQHSRRRRRDSRRPRPPAPQLLRQGDGRRVARRDARRAPRRAPHDRDDDVRHRRDDGGADRAHGPAARAAGRDRRLHGVHHLELSARAHRARRRRKPPASSTCARWRSPASCSTTSTTCRRRG